MPRFPGLGPDSGFARLVEQATRGHLTPRGVRAATLVAAVALAFGLVALLGFVQVSSSPAFCGGVCHIMKPYYQSWKHSSHRNVACVECHISPGVTAEIRKKYEAMSMVAKYITGTSAPSPGPRWTTPRACAATSAACSKARWTSTASPSTTPRT